MKHIFKAIAACLAILPFAACVEEEVYPTPYQEPIDGLRMFTGTIESFTTKTTMTDKEKPVWEVGDLVGIFTEEESNVKFRLKENLNTSAVFIADDNVGISGQIEKLYAYYPYSEDISVENGKLSLNLSETQSYRENSFSAGACPMLASATTRSLLFKHLCGVVKIKLSNTEFGKVTSINLSTSNSDIMAGPAEVDMNYGSNAPALTMLDAEKTTITLDCGEGIDITTSGVSFYFVVPAGAYEQLVFDIENAEGEIFTSKTRTALEVVRGRIADAGLAKVYIEEFFYGKSNCIQHDEPGTYSFDAAPYFTTDSYGYAYEFYTRDNLKLASSAGLAWQSKTDMITNVSLSEDKKTVTFTAAKTGNALIALYDEDGAIIWSFHLWISPVEEVVYPNGYVVLDRNLGATAKTKGSTEAWGLHYQWGRKDPFPEITVDPTRPQAAVTVVSYFDKDNQTLSFKAEPSKAGVDHRYSISRPMTFIQKAAAGNQVDWIWAGGSNNLWGNPEGYSNPDIKTIHKSVYDPCPEGYMVSPVKLYSGNGVATSSSENILFDQRNSGRTLTYNGLDEWYPAARAIHHNWPTGFTKNQDVVGRYWLSSPHKDNKWKALSVTWGPGAAVMYPEMGQFRGFGFSVRCVKVVAQD